MTRLLLVASAAAVLLTGCGGPPSASRSVPEPSDSIAAVATPVRTPATKTSTLVVDQQGTAPVRTLWYLRIENMAAEPLHEQAYPGQRITLSRSMSAGDYRLIVWHRRCAETCPAGGEKGLGPLEQVCGAKIHLVAGGQVNASAAVGADGNCVIKIHR